MSCSEHAGKQMNNAIRFSAELSVLIKAALNVAKDSPNFSDAMAIDEKHLMELARWHQVQSLLYDHLNGKLDFIATPYFEKLKEFSVNDTVYNMIFLRKSLELNADLNTSNVGTFLMKGALWAWMLYEKPGLREFGDIDFFLKREDIINGLEVLKRHGFQPDAYRKFLLQDHSVSALYFQTDYQLPLVPDTEGIVGSLEIQWNSTYPRFAYSFAWDELMAQPMIFEVSGEKITVPSISNQLLMMLVHHAGVEQWDKLKYVGDFVRILRKFSDKIDWPYVTNVAREKGFYRLLKESIGLVRVLTGEDFGHFLNDSAISQFPSERFLRTVVMHWENKRLKPMTKSWRIFYFNMIYRDRPGDRVKILFKHLAYLLEWRLLIPKAQWYYRKGAK
jgi:hypothetical protein